MTDRVLVLDGGRQMLPMLKWLHDLDCDITTISRSRLDTGYASRYPQHKLLSGAVNDEEYRVEVDREICSGKYDIVIPLSDKSTQYMSMNCERLSKYAKLPIPKYEIFMKAYDKQQTMEICQQNNIPCTRTMEKNEEFDSFIRKSKFPIAVKPRSACGSIGFRRINDQSEWNELLKNKDFDIADYVIQEYVNQDGAQYNVHLFMDDNGELSFAVPTQKCRWFPVDGGASCFCRIVDRRDLIEQCERLLKKVNWRGYCEIEMIEDKAGNTVKIMEINGRTSASIKICQIYGINVAEYMLNLAYGRPIEPIEFVYKDKRMRCIHTDLLWLLKSKDRFKTTPAWFDCRHTHDQIFSVDDPIPFFAFSFEAVANYRSEMKKRTR